MRLLVIVGVIVPALLASRASAQLADAGAPPTDAGGQSPANGDAEASAPPIAPPAPAPGPAGAGWSEPFAPSPEPLLVVAPAAPAAPSPDGPGDEEDKADFQATRPTPDGSPLRLSGRAGSAMVYGFGQLDYLHDSTQSLGVDAGNATLSGPSTYRGDNGHYIGTLCGSRLGARLATPADYLVRGFAVAELGPSMDGADPCVGNRLRHLYLAMRSPALDVLIGKYYGLVGWGGKGFLPNTAAFLAPPGQLYHLESQVRASHIFRWAPIDLELAGALGTSPQRAPATAEPQLGVRIAVNGWRGAAAQGVGPPVAAPLQVGLSWGRRVFEVNPLVETPTTKTPATGQVWALDLFAPIVPARGDDLSNAASITLEMTLGDGFADWYPGLTGGVSFPVLPNPGNSLQAPVYAANIAPGIVTFDSTLRLVPIEWHAIVVGAQYHLPFHEGRRVWASGTASWTRSSNAASLTPMPGLPFIWAEGRYLDLNVFVAVTNALQVALSSQVIEQTFADRLGIVARNTRSQLSVAYFF
jgi:hypothetical protein